MGLCLEEQPKELENYATADHEGEKTCSGEMLAPTLWSTVAVCKAEPHPEPSSSSATLVSLLCLLPSHSRFHTPSAPSLPSPHAQYSITPADNNKKS